MEAVVKAFGLLAAALTVLFFSALLVGLVRAETAVLPELLLAVQLNGIDTGDTALVLQGADGGLFVGAADLARWRLPVPVAADAAWPQDGLLFHRLDAIAGLTWRLDPARQLLMLDAPASLFGTTRLNLDGTGRESAPSAPGGFFNYDLSSTRTGTQVQTGALLEVGAFNRLGSGSGSLAVRNGFATGPQVVRLETTWTHDMPGNRASLRLGDTVGGAGQWGRPVRLGGVQWASNFATQPGFISFPLPAMQGEAALPSTVDLYVNGALQLRRDIPAGPFSLQQLPVVTGQGEARLVVRDLLGREQVIVAPYYATPRLLKPDLHEFSYELGRVRENFGLVSNQYGRAAVLATHRLGLNERLTVEGRGEWVGSQQTAGVGAVMAWPAFGTASAAVAASRSERADHADRADLGGTGGLLNLGMEHLGALYGLGANAQFASSRFAQIGQAADRPAPRRNFQSYLSIATGRGSISLAYVQQIARDAEAVRLVSLGYSVSLGSAGFINLSLVRTAGRQGGVAVALNFVRSLDTRTTAGIGANWRDKQGENQGQVQLQRNPPAGDGASYKLSATSGASQRVTAGGTLQHSAGTVGLDVDLSRDETAVRVGANGGVAWIDGGLYASRRIDSSFALVQVPGQAGVGIYADNQLVARTGADGRALVPRLRPWQSNPLRIEQADLPMDAQVDALAIDAVPGWRSGLVLRFPVRRSRSATLAVTTADGKPMRADAVAQPTGQAREYPFGSGGRLFLYELETVNHVEVRWQEHEQTQRCSFELNLPQSDDLLPDLGTHRCLAIAP